MTENFTDEVFHEARGREALLHHNAHWGRALSNWWARGGVEWTQGRISTAGLRGWLDTFLPWRDIARSLRRIARAYLPSDEWTPQILQDGAVSSLWEFWEELPEYQGRIVFEAEELPSFLCACADPPRYGTDIKRYPHQLSALRLMHFPAGGDLLDLGCGVGLGTLEALDALKLRVGVGVTKEPLEAWMANRRTLPHDKQRARHFAIYSHCFAEFYAGDILDFEGKGAFSVILCNGLAGGRFLCQDAQYFLLLEQFQRLLAQGGVVALANVFHEGRRPSVERLREMAAQRGWKVTGTWQNIFLQRN